MNDLKFASRQLLKKPSLIAVAMLCPPARAIGDGSNRKSKIRNSK